jgi:hypothetical protein
MAKGGFVQQEGIYLPRFYFGEDKIRMEKATVQQSTPNVMG